MQSKSLASSKTFWFNALTVLATVLTYAVDQSVFTPETSASIMTATGIINVILRKVTNTAATIS